MGKIQKVYTQEFKEEAVRLAHPSVAYVHWLREGMLAERWNSDPTQPCLLYKVYREVERIPLDARIPLNMGEAAAALRDDAPAPLEARAEQRLAWMLYYTHNLTRYIRSAPGSLPSWPEVEDDHLTRPVLPSASAGPQPHAYPLLGRPVPSGGSLHPLELYLVVTSDEAFPPGVYHYDSLHHTLDVLRQGDYRALMASALPLQCRAASCSAFLLVGVCFQKNHQKYTGMSYRLQMLDAGIVTEQLRFLARRFQQKGTLCFQFQDRPLHQLVGLDMREECIYAVLALEASGTAPERSASKQTCVSSEHLPQLTTTHIQPFTPFPRHPLLDALYSAALQDECPPSACAQPLTAEEMSVCPEALEPGECQLPPASFLNRSDLSSVLLRARRTSFNAIDSAPMALEDLASLLAYAGRGCEASELWSACACRIYCVLARVGTLAPGIYRYQSRRHALQLIQAGEQSALLRQIASAPNIHPQFVPVNLFFTGDYELALRRFGGRGLRMCGLEIGRVLQRASLAAAERGLAIHIHLSYFMRIAERHLLRLPEPSQIALASAMLGRPRQGQGGLFEMNWY